MYGDNNLFNPQWTTGSLSAIAPIVQVVGFICMSLISIGGFFMVVLPLMRNVVNGIVCVAPNLCEKIHTAHMQKLGIDQFKNNAGGNQIVMVMGSITTIIFSCFPDFIAMSDFEDGIRDPKSYMIRGIPIMCVSMFIGVFIFYGYPAKIGEKVADASTSVIDMLLNNVDPKAWIEKIPTNLARPDLSTDKATDNLGKNTNTVAKSIYSAFTSKYSAMSKDNRIELSHAIEGWVNNTLSQISEYSDSAKYKLSVETRIMSYNPQLNDKAVWPTPAHDTKDNIFIFQVKAPVSDTFDVGVPGGTVGDYFMINLKFFELADKEPESATVDVNVTAAASDLIGSSTNKKGESSWTLPKGMTASKGGTVTVNGINATVETKSDTKVLKFNASVDEVKNGTGPTSGVFVVDGSLQHPVKSVKFSGSNYVFTPVDTTKWNSWGLGESPKPVKDASVKDDEESKDK